MTAQDLCALFGRYTRNDDIAGIKVRTADFAERESEARLHKLRDLWQRIYGGKP